MFLEKYLFYEARGDDKSCSGPFSYNLLSVMNKVGCLISHMEQLKSCADQCNNVAVISA